MINKLLTLYFLFPALLFANEAILKLDTKGHTALTRDIIVTKDKDIISANDDKTIRIWDSTTGQEKRKILGEIGSGSEGKIYTIALSSDEQYLAVGGYLSYDGNYEYGNIRIYNYKTGKLLQVLKSHSDVVLDLAFSPDDNYLISASFDKTAKIWDARNNFSLTDTIGTHTESVHGVGIFKKDNRYYAVTAGYDNSIALYDIKAKKSIAKQKHNYKLKYLALSKKHIAVSGKDKEIVIYDLMLNHIKTIYSKTKTKPTGLAYSKDGSYLIAGNGTYPYSVNIYNTSDYSIKSSFGMHSNLTMGVGFLDKYTAVSAGGNNNEIYIWDIQSKSVKKKIEGVGDKIWSVGIKDDIIAWGNKFDATGDYHKKQSSFQKSLNLTNYSINKADQNFNRISTINGQYSLDHTSGGKYGYNSAVLEIKKDSKVVNTITKGSTDGYRNNCYGWWGDYIVSGGMNGHLNIYNKSGKKVASLVGHIGEIWSIALEGDRLVSGGDDQTLIVWDLKQINENDVRLVKPTWFSKAWFDWIKKNYPSHSVSTEYGIRQFYNQLIKDGDNNNAKKLVDSSAQRIYPMLDIFVSKDNEYIVWSESGYFTSSVGGDKYVGYHINQGPNKEARYVGSDKYFDTFYRPDVIANILKTGSEKKAIVYASRNKKVETVDVVQSLPPVVSLLSSSNLNTSKNSITIKYQIDSKEPVTKTIITVNGNKIDTRALKFKKESNIKTITVDLENGENIISIKARNRYAFSDEVLVNAYKKTKIKVDDIYKPTLYLLSIGISKYENPEFNLGVADKDALAISEMMKSQKGKVYKDVVVKTFTNANAKSDDILDGLDWIDKEVTSKDVAMIFIAGHGVNDERGNYYFLSHEANLDRLRRTAVKWIEIEDTISNLPSKTILLADTCHSGNIAGTRRDITSAVKSIINTGSGSIIMTATTGNGYSYEQSNWGHGAFTKSILEGLDRFKADYDGDGTVTIKEIDLYVTNRVKKLTKGKQKPTTIIPASIPDFALGVK